MRSLRSLPLCVSLCILSSALLGTTALAQAAAPAVRPTVRIVSPVDESQLVTLKGNVNPHANARNDRGPVSSSLPLADLTLVLNRSPEQQAAFDAYVNSQYDPNSPNYHQWLTPAQIGAQYGPAQADIATISSWLASHGFVVKSISPDRMTIRFGGTAGQAEAAFHTQIHNLSVDGVSHYANMTDPQIPAALSPVVVGIKALHNFLPHPLHRMGNKVQFDKASGRWQRIVSSAATTAQSSTATAKQALAAGPRPQFGVGVPANPTQGTSAYLEEDVTPYDFATIYNVLPLWQASTPITGSGQTIAIAGTSKINLADVTTYRSQFSLPAGLTPVEIDTGEGPAASECTSTSPSAVCGIGDLEENTLDVEVSGAVATGAQIKLVVTGQNQEGTVDTVFDSANYVVQNLTAKILSVSYGECELGQGTSGNVAYYDLWQSAAAEGISVFVAAGDSGSPSCDDGLDYEYGNPYTAQYGLSVSGIASTPYNTAIGGTDFSWCKPTINGSGDVVGCPLTTSSAGPYWNTSNTSSEGGASAAGYVPEIPWNDTCENPLLAKYLESVASDFGESGGSTPEEACNFVYNDYSYIYETQDYMMAEYVDTVGGSGGASNCVVNNTSSTSNNLGTCGGSGTTSTGSANGSLTLYQDGWPKPTWQDTSIPGMPSDGVRDLPDISFFSGDGTLSSATLICLSSVGACSYSATSENVDEEVGGTSVASPEMAGVMALIDQKSGAPQGLANPGLYSLAMQQSYSSGGSCSAENVKNTSASCYFNDVDTGTNAMPCNLNNGPEGGYIFQNGQWEQYEQFQGVTSPNCSAINSGDVIGTLVGSGTTPAYNADAGYDLATGLGSLNVANVVNAWHSDAGTASSTMNVTLNPSSGSISASTAITLTVTVTGTGTNTPSGTIVVTGGGFSGTGTLATTTVPASSATITIPPSSLSPGPVTLTVTYSGDTVYASKTATESVTVLAVTPTVMVTAPATDNVANAVTVSVAITGPTGAPAASGDISLTGGGYSSNSVTLTASGTATITIPPSSLNVGSDVLTVTYNGSANYYAQGTGQATVLIVSTPLVQPVVTVTATPTTVDSSQALSVGVTVAGTPTPTNTVMLTAGSYTSQWQPLVAGVAAFTVPGNSLSAGTANITASYSGDAVFASATKTISETVTQSTYAVTPGTVSPATVAPGGTATVTISGSQSSSDYTGTVTFNSCSPTSSSVASPNAPPTCSVSGTIVYTSGTPNGSATATVNTTAPTTGALAYPKSNGKGLLGAGGGAVLAFLVFLGIPARRRSWRAMLGMVVMLAVLGGMAACGGGSGGGSSSVPGTSAGTYTFTVQATGNDPANTPESTTFTVTVN